MNSKKLGIFTCTRNRTESLNRLISNIESHASNLSDIEVWIGYDWDDKATAKFIKDYSGPVNLQKYVNLEKTAECLYCGEKYVNRHSDVINPMVKKSNCDYVWILNDDIKILTEKFDWLISNTIELRLQDCLDRIFYGMCDQYFSTQNPPNLEKRDFDAEVFLRTKYSCYPIMTRELVDALGFALPSAYPDDGADIILGAIIGSIGVPRKFHVPVLLYDNVEDLSIKKKKVNPGHFGMTDVPSGEQEINRYKRKLKQEGLSCAHHQKGMISFSSFIYQATNKLRAYVGNILKDLRGPQDMLQILKLDIRSTYQCNNCGHFIHTRTTQHDRTISCQHCGVSYPCEKLSEMATIDLEGIQNQVNGFLKALRDNQEKDKKNRRVELFIELNDLQDKESEEIRKREI